MEFARLGWEVTVLTRRVPSRRGSEVLDGVYVRRIALPGRGPAAKLLDVLLTWLWLLRRRRQLTAVSVMMDADFAVAACMAGLRASTVMTWVTRGDATRLLSGRLGALRRRLLRGARHVVLTPRMKSELASLGVRGATVIPVPVDTGRFRPPSAAERTESADRLALDRRPIILTVGHLQERKGVDLLLEALRLVLDAGQDAQLVVVGGPVESADHAYVDRLRRIIGEDRLEAAVMLAGAHDDVRPYLFASDVFCLASHREGMPNVLLEAMACGLACVAPASAGGDELLTGSSGVIPPTNSPTDLAAALTPLLEDPGRRRDLGAVAAERVRSRHRPEQVAAAYEELW